MKRIINLALTGVFLLAVHSVWADDMATGTKDGMTAPAMAATPMATPAMKAKKKKAKKVAMKTIWVCPMGDYTGDKPGKCPNCQMDLVKKEVPADTGKAPATPTEKMN